MHDSNDQVKAGKLVAKCLSKLGVEYTTGIPGSHVLSIYDGLRDAEEIRHITVRHESNAAVIGDAYGRLVGKPLGVLVTAGPGATNTVTGVAQAFGACSPLLVITGNVSLDSGPSAFHGVDDPYFLVNIFRPITKASILVAKPERITSSIVEGYNIAMSGRKGPVYISIPIDVGIKSIPVEEELECNAKHRPLGHSKLVLKDISKRISKKKIVLLIGAEVATSIPNDAIIELADSLNAPVITQIEGLGYFPQDNELYAGYLEKSWDMHPSAYEVLKEAEIMLSLGVRPGEEEYKRLREIFRGDIIYIGYTRGIRSEGFELVLSGDLGEYIEGMKSIEGKSGNWYIDPIAKGLRRCGEIGMALSEKGENGYIHPGYAAKVISEYVEKGSLLIADVGSHETWARHIIACKYPVRYLYPGNYGGMGFAVPAAIGGNLAGYDSISVIIGDGGLLMCMEELSTIVECGVDVKIFVFNDARYGMIYHMQKEIFDRDTATRLSFVDFAKVAEGLGLDSVSIDRVEDLEGGISSAYKADGPILVDIRTDYKVRYITF